MDKWLELEDTYLTNQPTIGYEGRGKNRKPVPDPDVEPTEMWLFVYECERRPRSIKRRRRMEILKGGNAKELDELLLDFSVRPGVMLIPAQAYPNDYINSNAEPQPIAVGA